jgi:hypothetical protein
MVFQTRLFAVGRAGSGFYVMNVAKENAPGGELEKKGAESLDNGAVTRNIRIPAA